MPGFADRRPVGAEWAGEAALRAQIARLVRSSVVGQSVRQSRQEHSEQLDLDAVVDAAVAQRAGVQPDPRVYRDRHPRGRDLAMLIILDVSQSTAAIGARRPVGAGGGAGGQGRPVCTARLRLGRARRRAADPAERL